MPPSPMVALLVAIRSDYRSETCEGDSLLWSENVGKAQQDDHTVLTEITANGGVIFKPGSGGGVNITIP
ncbi:hypothetical protein [Thalassospira lucentensis]|uniref:hypothetical protein n=1 Tax=Thalassospira lucentensis TaxID=168935 RepID=UPI00142D3710|nr:hypothetical protein [Thalassospira lucentensis]NIZ03556.1 hypothetical protein [Thalassospira lucentensis]